MAREGAGAILRSMLERGRRAGLAATVLWLAVGTAAASGALAAAQPFSDPIYAARLQWGLGRGGWTPALALPATRPTIAILDSGLDLRHPEWSAPGLVAFPHSVIRGDSNVADVSPFGHGTAVAGIAAAPADGLGIVGVAPAAPMSAQVMPVQVADRSGQTSDEDLVAGIRWAVLHGARVINISMGGPGYRQAVQDAVDWAFARGALVVAAAGNEGSSHGTDPLSYPAGYAHVLGVGAQCDGDVAPPDCPQAYGPALFTSHNRALDVIAPGVDVISTVPTSVRSRRVGPGYALMDGTSAAAPYVAGVAALVFAAHPEASPSQVMRQIENTALPMGPAGWNDRAGHGVVDPAAALAAPLPPPDPGEPNDDVPLLADGASVAGLAGPTTVTASVGRDDPTDLYPIVLRRGEAVVATLASGARRALSLSLWRPGTTTVWSWMPSNERNRLRTAPPDGPGRRTLAVRAPRSGRYFLEVAASGDGGRYTLTVLPAAPTAPVPLVAAATSIP